MAKNDIYIRSFSGLLYVLIVIFTVLFNPLSLFILTVIFSTLCIYEFLKIQQSSNWKQSIFVYTNNVLVLMKIFGILPISDNLFIAVLLFIFLIWFTVMLFSSGTGIMHKIGMPVFGIFYIIIPFAVFSVFSLDSADYNWQRPLFVFILVWSSDTFAYISGRLFGKTYLFPALSPKKTVEGWIGGTLLAGAAGGILAYFWPWIGLYNGIILGILVSVFGTVGDLFESSLKRNAGIKDSGRILPGHGGALDRFDAFIFASVIVFAWYKVFTA